MTDHGVIFQLFYASHEDNLMAFSILTAGRSHAGGGIQLTLIVIKQQ
ncbi:hypothetical protein [Paenibacillus alkalitolerans]|nr:hypothetical protein [Paenibacillus alkalitolerans]